MLEYQYLNSVETNSEFEKTLLIDNPSDAHLNICVALSHLGKHQDALQHAMKALVFIQNELCERQLLSSPATHTKDSDTNNEILNNEILKPIEDRYVVLAIAYHNLAVQYEFLNMVHLFVYIVIFSLILPSMPMLKLSNSLPNFLEKHI